MKTRVDISGKAERGFSLIEVILTIVIVAVAAGGVLSVFSEGIGRSADPLLLNRAINLAQERMEEALALRTSGGFSAVLSNPGGAFAAPFSDFSWSRTVSCVTAADLNTPAGAPPCASGYAHIAVTVTNAAVGTITVDSVIANY